MRIDNNKVLICITIVTLFFIVGIYSINNLDTNNYKDVKVVENAVEKIPLYYELGAEDNKVYTRDGDNFVEVDMNG